MSSAARPTRLAFCITELDIGGAEQALVQLLTGLDRCRWEPSVFCLAGRGALVGQLEQAGIPVSCLGAGSWRNVLAIGRLVRQLREVKPALLQTFLFHANMAGRIAGRLAGVPRIVSGIRVAEKRSRIPLWLDRLTSSIVDHHVCVSRAVAGFSAEQGGLLTEKITVIPNGVDADRFRRAAPKDLAEFGIPPGSQTVLFVGRLDPQKAPLVLLEAANGLIPAHHNLHVLLVGDGPLNGQLHAWVRERDLQSRVHFAGWRPDVPELLAAGDCLVLPSRWEGMPNVLLEAMAAGLPVVATDVEGAGELICNHKTGLLVPPNSPQELASGLSLVLGDADLSRTMAQTAQSMVIKEFTWDSVVERYETLYTTLIAR